IHRTYAPATLRPFTTLFRSKAFNSEDISGSLEYFAPQSKDYKALKQALAQYRKIEEEGGWPVIDTEFPEGDSATFWMQIAERLRSEEHTSELQSRENLVCRL